MFKRRFLLTKISLVLLLILTASLTAWAADNRTEITQIRYIPQAKK